jgi:hypothetical protein
VQKQNRFTGSLIDIMDTPAVEIDEAVLGGKEFARYVEGQGRHRHGSGPMYRFINKMPLRCPLDRPELCHRAGGHATYGATS